MKFDCVVLNLEWIIFVCIWDSRYIIAENFWRLEQMQILLNRKASFISRFFFYSVASSQSSTGYLSILKNQFLNVEDGRTIKMPEGHS
jgi:hypothetical protein